MPPRGNGVSLRSEEDMVRESQPRSKRHAGATSYENSGSESDADTTDDAELDDEGISGDRRKLDALACTSLVTETLSSELGEEVLNDETTCGLEIPLRFLGEPVLVP